jgi:hypothetical protein
MKTRHILRSLALLALCSAATLACADPVWEGKATNDAGTFNFGTVSFTVKGKQIVDFRITRVTTSGCGGMKDVIVPNGIAIKGTDFAGSFQPIPGIDDTIIVTGTISGTNASGTFSEGPTCRNSGKFTASPK